MRIRIAVGTVEISLSGVTYTPRQVTALTKLAAELAKDQPPLGEEDEERASFGLTANVDIDEER